MPLDDDDRAKMVELAAMGLSGEAIAERFGITPQYVSQILAKEADDLAALRAGPYATVRLGASRTHEAGGLRKPKRQEPKKETPARTGRPSRSPRTTT